MHFTDCTLLTYVLLYIKYDSIAVDYNNAGTFIQNSEWVVKESYVFSNRKEVACKAIFL